MVLTVLIVGGGIAGLATALALRKKGHHVQVLETTQLAAEDIVGPNILLGPNSNDILRSWNIDLNMAKATLVKEAPGFNLDGSVQTEQDGGSPPGWRYYECIKLHEAMYSSATATHHSGHPVVISSGTKVTSVDLDEAKITLADGRILQGDVVVGADGTNSIVRQSIVGVAEFFDLPEKRVTVHFSVATTQFAHNTVVQRFQHESERYEKWVGTECQISVYSSQPGLLLFDCTYPRQAQNDLNAATVKDQLLSLVESAHTDFAHLLNAVELKDISFWSPNRLPAVNEWTRKRITLVGDAAHPFLPNELPGIGQSLNDARVLADALQPDVDTTMIEAQLAEWAVPRQARVRALLNLERASWLLI